MERLDIALLEFDTDVVQMERLNIAPLDFDTAVVQFSCYRRRCSALAAADGAFVPLDFDSDSVQARNTRIRILDQLADTDTYVFGTHFTRNGYVKRNKAAFIYESKDEP